jgi:hypothetical protein
MLTKITQENVRKKLKSKGMTLRARDGEYRVNFKDGPDSDIYYTNDLQDALETGLAMHRRKNAQDYATQLRWRSHNRTAALA